MPASPLRLRPAPLYIEVTYKGYPDLPKILREKNAEGALFMRRVQPRLVKDVTELGISIVAVDTVPRLENINNVRIDDRRGGLFAGEYLFLLGHKRVAMIVPRVRGAHLRERLRGGDPGAREARGPDRPLLLERRDGRGRLRAARELGLKVPRDLGVIGFDDIVMSNYTDPPPTTVSVLKEHMGRRAMARLIELVDDRVKTELAPVDFVVRGTAKPRARSR